MALLTADVRKASDKFIRFFTKTDFMEGKSEETYSKMKASLIEHEIEDMDKETKLAPIEATQT